MNPPKDPGGMYVHESGTPGSPAIVRRAGIRPSRQSPGRGGDPLIMVLDRQAVGRNRASNTCRARQYPLLRRLNALRQREREAGFVDVELVRGDDVFAGAPQQSSAADFGTRGAGIRARR